MIEDGPDDGAEARDDRPGSPAAVDLPPCRLLAISRSTFYAPARRESPRNLALMRLIDAQFPETPWYGSRQMARHLCRQFTSPRFTDVLRDAEVRISMVGEPTDRRALVRTY